MDVKRRICHWRVCSLLPLKAPWNIPTCAPSNTLSISLCLPHTHTHMYFAEHDMIYSQGGGSAFVQMCASALWKIKTTDLYYTAHTDTGMHYIKPKNPSFPSAFSFLLQNIPLSSSIFSHLICQRLKKQRQKSRGEKSLPVCGVPCSAEQQNSTRTCSE